MPVDLVSGAIGASISCLVLQPLDVIKTRLQEEQLKKNASASKRIPYVIRNILETKGIFGVWQGVSKHAVLSYLPSLSSYTFAKCTWICSLFCHACPTEILGHYIRTQMAQPDNKIYD